MYRPALYLRMYSCRHITALNNTALVHGAHATNTSRVRKHFGSRYSKTRHLSPRYLWLVEKLRVYAGTSTCYRVPFDCILYAFSASKRFDNRRVHIHFDRKMSSLRTRFQEDRASHRWLSITIRHSSFFILNSTHACCTRDSYLLL